MEASVRGKADAFVYYYMAQAFVNSDTTGTMAYTLLEQLHSPTAGDFIKLRTMLAWYSDESNVCHASISVEDLGSTVYHIQSNRAD